MRLNEGKIGKQESVSLIAIAMVAATTYLLDSEKAYSKGNSTFIPQAVPPSSRPSRPASCRRTGRTQSAR